MHQEPSETASRPPGRSTLSRRRRTLAGLVVVLALAALAAMAPTVAARPGRGSSPDAAFLPPTTDPPDPPEPTEPPDPPDPPPTRPTPPTVPNPECDDAAGFARPGGAIPPGYVFTPTKFTGSIQDPQPDDTFVGAAAPTGRHTHTGRLRTRTVAGQEQVLVCAHVGTNTPEDALTPFPVTGPGGHPATIAPRVVLIDVNGVPTTTEFGAPGTDSTLRHYVGSLDGHEGYAQMWVPLPATLGEPGFIVRVEIRGTSALADGGTDQVMGADEVYVHVGPSPTSEVARVDDAVGVTVTAGAIGERPTDPGPDDLSALLEPMLKPLVAKRIRAFAPEDIDLGVDGELWGWSNVTFGSARLNSLGNNVHSAKLDVVNFNPTEGRGEITIDASLFPRLTVEPLSVGLVSITGGSCEATATVDVRIRAGFVIDVAPDGSKPELHITFVTTSGTVQSVGVSGRLDVYWLGSISCSRIEGDVRDGIDEGMAERLQRLQNDQELRTSVEAEVAEMLAPADLRNGPLSSVDVKLPSGIGFGLAGSRYTPTAPNGHAGGDVFISDQGMLLAAGTEVTDQGGSRFRHSYAPTSTRGVVPSLGGSYRPGTSSTYDVGLVINGKSVNQLLRAMTAGNAQNRGLLDLTRKVEGLNIAIAPASAPMYLPTAPQGWPAKAEAPVRLYVPSLRVAIPVPTVATMAADIRAGVDATIDETNHLVPLARASKVDVAVRFLRLGSVNKVKDPAADPNGIPAKATTAILDKVPPALGAVLTPIRIPDLRAAGSPPIHLDHLTVGTVGGGHLGAWVDVEPGPAPYAPPAIKAVLAPAGTAPTALLVQALDGAMPLPGEPGPVRVSWTVRDVAAPATSPALYQSPEGGEPVGQLVKGVVVSGLTERDVDACTGEMEAGVMVTVTAVKDGVTRTTTVPVGHQWAVTPDHVPPICNQDDPPPEPEPTIPPICRAKPWLCEDL